MEYFARYKFANIILLIYLINISIASHYISGIVDDAEDLESPDNKIITLWNPEYGIEDNLTDIIGISGNSGSPKTYSIDCEQLSTPCQENDTINIKIFDSGDGYASAIKEFNVTSENPDYVEEIKLNSPPVLTINYPNNNSFLNSENINFNCTYQDPDSSQANISLWANFSGSWGLISTEESFPGNIIFNEELSEGYYQYLFKGDDGIVQRNSDIHILTVDRTKPLIESLTLNTTYFCGETLLKITCETEDPSSIENVKIKATSKTSSLNYSATHELENNYTKTLLLSEDGTWNFTCYSEDKAGNTESQTSLDIILYPQKPNLRISNNNISFNNTSPLENEKIKINATIENNGCVMASDVLVKFYNDDPSQGGLEIGESQILSISNFSSEITSIIYSSLIGKTDVYVFADANSSISESNESDNIAKKTLNTPSWQILYGQITSTKVLGSENISISEWTNATDSEGNIFISDSESQIDWLSLMAIGKKVDMSQSLEDLSKIDEFLNMSDYIDSVSEKFSSASTESFSINYNTIESVQTIQSTENNNFKTGILWDYSDDTDGQYGGANKEDLIFVSKINKDSEGKYGTYDYEITVPAKLREYNKEDLDYVYFYYELI